MSIRRLDKAGRAVTQSISGKKSQVGKVAGGEDFARKLAELSGVAEAEEVAPVAGVGEIAPVSRDANTHQRRQQLQQAGELLDSLEALERDMSQDRTTLADSGQARKRLLETRDQALRTLSDGPEKGDERDLLHRTAVLATVELAKSERGDYK